MKNAIQPADTFGRWTVLRRSKTKHYWTCECACGAQRGVYAYSLLKGASTSCGCFLSEWTATKNFRHGSALPGAKRSRTYNIWANMKARCQNPNNHKFPDYGGRGITVCDRWQAFVAFRADMGEAPAGHSIDRIDNGKGYSPENCRWAPNSVQANNTRANRFITIDGKTQTLAQWSAESGVKGPTIARRLRAGFDPRAAVFSKPHQLIDRCG
jgi:hypothetical protein